MPEQLETRAHHVRVTRIHANGGHSTRDVDLGDREQWKRIVRGAKDTIESGGEHHMRPLYQDDGPAISAPSHLKLRVEALEAGARRMLASLQTADQGTRAVDVQLASEHLESLLGGKA